MRIAIELETPGDSRTMFRLLVDERLIAKEMTSAQAHVLVGDILERLALPKEPRENDGQPSTRVNGAAGREVEQWQP
jgi:hypothetical protein